MRSPSKRVTNGTPMQEYGERARMVLGGPARCSAISDRTRFGPSSPGRAWVGRRQCSAGSGPHRQTREHLHPLRPVRADHLLHVMVIDLDPTPLRDNLSAYFG
jgi:hypothetical protein